MKPKENYIPACPPAPTSWNINSEVSSSLCFIWVVQVTFFSFQKNKRILHPPFFYCDFEPVMQVWLSLEAFLCYHYACFRSLSISRVSSLSGGSLTVTINTLSRKLQGCMRWRSFKVLFRGPLFSVRDNARQHSRMTCSAAEYWLHYKPQSSFSWMRL